MEFFSCKDVKAGAFGTPFFARSSVEAQRGLAVGMRDNPSSPMANYPADFELWRVGKFDTERGFFIPGDPDFICGLAELKLPAQGGSNV